MSVFYKCSKLLIPIGFAMILNACGSSSDSDGNARNSHRIFVTSSSYDGDLGGLVGADTICTTVAGIAGISGSYRAVMSSSTESAFSRLDVDGSVYMMATTGRVDVASSGDRFWNINLESPINVDQNGATLAAMQGPWTGTNPSGGSSGIALTCTDWTIGNNTVAGSTGDTSTIISSQWINANGNTCDEMRPLYCIEE